ncbi:MAG TPA: hypothetical protein VNZ57_08375 [Longimicrobiales bacterium]|nr:hypothetical protein [Longimicrobiales bacterium]
MRNTYYEMREHALYDKHGRRIAIVGDDDIWATAAVTSALSLTSGSWTSNGARSGRLRDDEIRDDSGHIIVRRAELRRDIRNAHGGPPSPPSGSCALKMVSLPHRETLDIV